jgi:hypothetical protein
MLSADPSAPEITKWESLATHAGGVGEVALTVNDNYCECRNSRLKALRLTFSEPISGVTLGMVTVMNSASVDLTSAVTGLALEGDGSVLRVTLSPALADVDDYLITVTAAVTDLAGNALSGDCTRKLRVVVGDANGDGKVNVGDMTKLQALANWGQPVTTTTARCDVNLDGKINVGDLTKVMGPGCWGHQAPPMPPAWP